MPKKKPENKLTDKEQFERFKKTAREHGVDETGEEFERAFSKVSQKAQKKSRKNP